MSAQVVHGYSLIDLFLRPWALPEDDAYEKQGYKAKYGKSARRSEKHDGGVGRGRIVLVLSASVLDGRSWGTVSSDGPSAASLGGRGRERTQKEWMGRERGSLRLRRGGCQWFRVDGLGIYKESVGGGDLGARRPELY